MTENALILFLKYPERGTVKTRLARTLGDDVTYELYSCFLTDIAAMTNQVNAETVIVYSGPEGAAFPDFPGVRSILQRGDDIGERMYFAFQDVFALGFERCVLMGSDIPDLPPQFVNDALDMPAFADMVIGPGTDGGYYLVGCKRDSQHLSIFTDIPWGTADVFSETMKRIAEAGLIASQLPEWSDIDDVDDLKSYYKRNENRAKPSRVMAFLKSKVL